MMTLPILRGNGMTLRRFMIIVVAGLVAGAMAAPALASTPAETASISGVVVAQATHHPVPGVTVDLVADVSAGFFGVGPKIVATQKVGASGRYSFTGLAASDANGYQVCFATGATSRFEGQCWKDQPWDGWVVVSGPGFVTVPGQAISLAAGQHRTGVDAYLYPWTTLSGQVVDARTRAGVAGVTVQIRNPNEYGPIAAPVTGKNGRWTARVEGGAAKAQVCFDASTASKPYESGCFRRVPWPAGTPFPGTATPFSVRPAQVVGGLDVALARQG